MTTRFPDSRPSTNKEIESTVVDSSDTPAVGRKSEAFIPRSNALEVSVKENRGCSSFSGGGVAETSAASGGRLSISMSRDGETCELTLTSSLDGSGASASPSATADLMSLLPASDRKRKGREPVDDATTDYQSEDVEIESHEAKKQARGGANTKRSRAAEVHNLYEWRRRDRINEKMTGTHTSI